MKRAVIALAGVLTIACVAGLGVLPAEAQGGKKGKKSDVTIKNKSKWEIHHLFLSSTSDDEWGPDQLGDEVIGTGESFLLHSIPCDSYDVKLVDEDGDECEVEDIELCASSETWSITNDILLSCEGYE